MGLRETSTLSRVKLNFSIYFYDKEENNNLNL